MSLRIDAGDRAGPRGAEQHGENAAARGAEEDRPADLQRGDTASTSASSTGNE
jgi:hypothetical protein